MMTVVACGGGQGRSQSPTDPAISDTERSWGPLAVEPLPEGSGAALIAGTLKVTEDCVILDEQGEDVLLVWPADRTSWNPESRTIAFETRDGQMVTLTDGDEVKFGGGGSSMEEDGLSAEAFVTSVKWVSQPQPSCVTDARWFVGDVVGTGDS
ncbi:MAG: hypothetical protein ACRDWX_06700 [Acidimicrobiia bacterium]